MKETKTKFVAVEFNDNGSCKKVFQIMNLTESEYKKLLNQSVESKQHGREKSQRQEFRLAQLEKRQERTIFFLAKSIYDNYVDRGVLKEDKDFEKAVFDYFFNDLDLMPIGPVEFQKILEKIYGEFKDE